MKIHQLTLGSRDLAAQTHFYGGLLGFEINSPETTLLEIKAGETSLRFRADANASVYHFAFLIPTGSLEAAIDFVETKNIRLLPLRGEKIIHFDTGRSIYFFDPNGNIAELIERPHLAYPAKLTFEIGDIIRVNEIGHPVDQPIQASQMLMEQCGIRPLSANAFKENFCWVGDHEGAVIVVTTGRPWLPTDVSGVYNDFDMDYEDHGFSGQLRVRSGRLVDQT